MDFQNLAPRTPSKASIKEVRDRARKRPPVAFAARGRIG
jgi:hypothetical protein